MRLRRRRSSGGRWATGEVTPPRRVTTRASKGGSSVESACSASFRFSMRAPSRSKGAALHRRVAVAALRRRTRRTRRAEDGQLRAGLLPLCLGAAAEVVRTGGRVRREAAEAGSRPGNAPSNKASRAQVVAAGYALRLTALLVGAADQMPRRPTAQGPMLRRHRHGRSERRPRESEGAGARPQRVVLRSGARRVSSDGAGSNARVGRARVQPPPPAPPPPAQPPTSKLTQRSGSRCGQRTRTFLRC